MTDARKHHRRFTHQVLMRLALDEPERLVRNLRRSGVSYLKALWDACGSDYEPRHRVASIGLTVCEHAHSDTTLIFAIAVPEAVTATEAVMVGIVAAGGGTGEQATRYFVLEKSVGGGWGWETALVELAGDGSRHNYGEGCEAREDAMIRRVADVLMRDLSPGCRPTSGCTGAAEADFSTFRPKNMLRFWDSSSPIRPMAKISWNLTTPLVIIIGTVCYFGLSCGQLSGREYEIDKASPNGLYRVRIKVWAEKPKGTRDHTERAKIQFFKGQEVVHTYQGRNQMLMSLLFMIFSP